jgi:hypothetical protein
LLFLKTVTSLASAYSGISAVLNATATGRNAYKHDKSAFEQADYLVSPKMMRAR